MAVPKHHPLICSPCGHSICIECFPKLKNAECSVCKSSITSTAPNISLRQVVDALMYQYQLNQTSVSSVSHKITNQNTNVNSGFESPTPKLPYDQCKDYFVQTESKTNETTNDFEPKIHFDIDDVEFDDMYLDNSDFIILAGDECNVQLWWETECGSYCCLLCDVFNDYLSYSNQIVMDEYQFVDTFKLMLSLMGFADCFVSKFTNKDIIHSSISSLLLQHIECSKDKKLHFCTEDPVYFHKTIAEEFKAPKHTQFFETRFKDMQETPHRLINDLQSLKEYSEQWERILSDEKLYIVRFYYTDYWNLEKSLNEKVDLQQFMEDLKLDRICQNNYISFTSLETYSLSSTISINLKLEFDELSDNCVSHVHSLYRFLSSKLDVQTVYKRDHFKVSYEQIFEVEFQYFKNNHFHIKQSIVQSYIVEFIKERKYFKNKVEITYFNIFRSICIDFKIRKTNNEKISKQQICCCIAQVYKGLGNQLNMFADNNRWYFVINDHEHIFKYIGDGRNKRTRSEDSGHIVEVRLGLGDHLHPKVRILGFLIGNTLRFVKVWRSTGKAQTEEINKFSTTFQDVKAHQEQLVPFLQQFTSINRNKKPSQMYLTIEALLNKFLVDYENSRLTIESAGYVRSAGYKNTRTKKDEYISSLQKEAKSLKKSNKKNREVDLLTSKMGGLGFHL